MNFLKTFLGLCLLLGMGQVFPGGAVQPVGIDASIGTVSKFLGSIYISGSAGYGVADWNDLSATDYPSRSSTPVKSKDDGFVYGVSMGMEINHFFNISVGYRRYPKTTIYFDPSTIYQIPYPQLVADNFQIKSSTYLLQILAHFNVAIEQTPSYVFADFGPAYVHRNDMMKDGGRVGLSMGGGYGYNFGSKWTVQFQLNLVTGYGKSAQYVVEDYIPFLYSAECELMYHL